MPDITKKHSIPQGSNLKEYVSFFHYCDSFSGALITSESIEKITIDIFCITSWIEYLLRIRNFIVKPFGLYTPPQKKQEKERKLPFKEFGHHGPELIMGETDKHLDFWVSVLKEPECIVVTTVVKFHHVFGRLYFLPVKPFHKLIVRQLLKRFIRRG
jgi:hypothetical protein